ncbi:MAG: DUF4209 domain-containing protein [Nitrospirae bacterium]|nr:DUF4209 domain-containing protein [Nitrospirota bacterium]
MNPSKQTLDEKLAELETISGVTEHDIESAISTLRKADSAEEACQEWQYEVLAFSFLEERIDKKNSWGTNFGPMMVFKGDDGRTVERPSLQQIDKGTLSYWQQRAETTTNPLLRARYAGLVWELAEPAVGEKPNHTIARIYCEAMLAIADKRLHQYEVDVIKKLGRALSLAISLNDPVLIERAKQTIMKYEHEVAEDSKPGWWGFSFDLLIGNKKVSLSEAEEKEIVDTLEKRLVRLKGGEPWRCENAAERLARYYRGKDREVECSRVIRDLGSTFENAAKNAAPLAASSWLEHMYQVYRQFNLMADAERVALVIRELGPKVLANMKPLSYQQEIPREEFDAYIESIVAGTFEEAFARIVMGYIPKRGEVEKQLHDLSRRAPLSFLFTKQLMDHRGRVVATIGSLEDDPDGHVVNQMSQNMHVVSVFLAAVLDRAINKFSVSEDALLNYLLLSPLFDGEQGKFLVTATHAYLQKDFVVAIHLYVPQIEAAIRNLAELTGGAVLKPRDGGGFHLRTLDELLRTEQVRKALGEDIALYFRVVLTDQRGWNIRNVVCHGTFPHQYASRVVADRLLHILIVLAQLRVKEA